MTTTVALRANTLDYPEGGGHFWVYLNWALGLRSLGCQLIWVEFAYADDRPGETESRLRSLRDRLSPYGLAPSMAVRRAGGDEGRDEWLVPPTWDPVDLLLDIGYTTPVELERLRQGLNLRRTALVDIDPGLLQVWMSRGELVVAPHDINFSIGETVGTPAAAFPDCGLEWHYTPPPVILDQWPLARAGPDAAYTTVCHWWDEWLVVEEVAFDNSKRESFRDYLDLPTHTTARLELALDLAQDEEDERRMLEQRGWSVREGRRVASTPSDYRAYIQASRGEFSCAKPSCMRLRNAWISDRTLCYLASGKPAIVQHTGPSGILPDASGLFRFHSPHEAVRALATVEADYDHHARLARQLVEEHFDARKVVAGLLERALA
ncbi:MAG: glycosyltransferase [Nitriliruptorales bacterium]